MDLFDDMGVFLAVARAKSFSIASKTTRIPVSSLSRRISKLEERLGVQLLNRSSRKVALTEQGLLYAERSRAILEAVASAGEEIKLADSAPSGRLRVSMPATFGELFLSPLFVQYTKRFPDVTFELDLSQRIVDIVAEGFDLAIRIGPQKNSTLATRKIATARMGLFASDDYLRGAGKLTEPRDLATHSCLRLVRAGSARDDTWELQNRGKRVSLSVLGRAAVNHTGMLRKMATLGMGIAMLDEVLVVDDLETGVLRRILPEWSSPPIAICAVTPSKVLAERTRLLLDCFREHLAVVRRRVADVEPG